MRLLCAIATLVALEAHATWVSSSVTGTPKDVTIVDAGVVATSGSEAALFSGNADAGITKGTPVAGLLASATWRAPNCVIALTTGALIVSDASCGSYLYGLTGATNAGRLRSTPSGAIYAYGQSALAYVRTLRLETDGGAAAADWAQFTPASTDSKGVGFPLAVTSLSGGAEVATWAYVTLAAAPTLDIYVDGGLHRTLPTGIAARDIAIYENAGLGAAIMIDNTSGLVSINEDLLSDGGFTALGLPAGNLTASFTTSQGSAYGRGFGMIVAGATVYGAVPNPAAPGKAWVPRDAGFPAPLLRAACLDPSFCGAITSSAVAPNVYAYFNQFPPSAEVAVLNLTPGQSVAYSLDAGDKDGDPIWITWIDGGFTLDGGDPRSITITAPAGASCGTFNADVVAVLSDGWQPHDTQVTVPVLVTGLTASAPALSPAGGLGFDAGGPSASAVASTPDGGCAVSGYVWTLNSDAGFVLAVDGGTAVVTPPAHFCGADGGVFSLTVAGLGTPDASTSIPVTISPWGDPNPPAFSSQPRLQDAGTTGIYPPDPGVTHVCATANGYPGTILNWSGDAGGVSGISFQTSNTSAIVVVSSDSCASGTVTASGQFEVAGLPGQHSTPASLAIQIVPSWTPITAATPFDAGFSFDPSRSLASGEFSVGTNCVADRDLYGVVVISQKGGAQVGDAGPVSLRDGGWSVQVAGACAGGTFVATSTLLNDAGAELGPRLVQEFVTDTFDASVPLLTISEVPVSCDQGASSPLAFAFQPSDCQSEAFSWTQTAGPSLAQSPSQASMAFATQTGDLQAQAGQQLSWSITGTIGPGNSATAVRSVLLRPVPFIELSHRTSAPVAREEEAVIVEVTLKNPTACAVSGLLLHEALGGLKLIPGTVRFQGAAFEPTLGDGFLEVPKLALGARESQTLTYAARVPLLAAARPEARIALNGYDVTAQRRGLEHPATGCGCETAPSSAVALLLLGVALVRARRRSG